MGGGHGREADTVGRSGSGHGRTVGKRTRSAKRTRSGSGHGWEADTVGRSGSGHGREAEGREGAACGLGLLLVRSRPVTGS